MARTILRAWLATAALLCGAVGSASAQVANDGCADAAVLNAGDTYEFDSCGATLDGAGQTECDPRSVVSDVWFSFTFASDGATALDVSSLAGSGFIEVYAGTCGAMGAPVACRAQQGLDPWGVTIRGVAGSTYLIRLGFFAGDCGPVSVTLGAVGSAAGVGSAFTYQGQVSAGGVPLNGPADFEFRLFGLPAGGTQVGPTVYHRGLSVTGGLVSTLLDFGSGVCVGDDRWLEITVNGTTLSPRQELTATPYALYAVNAGTATYATSAGSAATAARADNGGSGGVFIESFARASMGDVGYNSNANAFVPVVQTDKVVSLPAGTAVFDWTLPGMSTGNGKVVQLRANIAGVLGPAITYQFGAAFTELPMCGHIVVTIPQAVTGTVRLEVKVPSPSGGALWYPGAGSPNGGVNGNGTGMTWTLVVYKD